MLPPEFPSAALSDTDRQRFEAYWERFAGQGGYGPGHFILACYAAFPVVLTPDLLYKLWMNFGKYRNAQGRLVHIEQVAVADLLLAPFLTPLQGDIYRMSARLRQACLRYLRDVQQSDNPMGLHSLEELAYFLLHYLQKYYVTETPAAAAFREAQEWSALAYLQPELAIHQLTESFRKPPEQQSSAERLRLTLALQQLVEQERSTKTTDEEHAFEAFAAFSEGWKAYLEGNRIQATEQFRQARGTLMTMPVPRPVHDALQEAPTPKETHLRLLLIAVDRYEEVPDLQGSVSDARRLRAYLEGQYRLESVYELYDADATLESVTTALADTLRSAGHRDNVLIYFAGHGINRPGTGDAASEAGLVLTDYRASGNLGILTEAAFAALVQENNRNDPAITLVLDTDSGTQRWLDIRNDQHVILAASRRDQPSYETRSDEGPGGAFTTALIEELEKTGGIVTYRRLFQLVQANVRRRYRQNPQLFGSPRAVCRLFASTRDSEVPRLQELLAASGYYQGPVDGHHGAQTAAALRRFREAHRLSETEDPLGALERKVLVQDARTVQALYLGPPLPKELNGLEALLAELPKTDFQALSGEEILTEEQAALEARLDAGHVLLLGLSRDFLTAGYSQSIIAKAIEEAQVDSKILLPILLEDCDWAGTDLRDFPVLPRNRQPIYSDYWASPEEALKTVLEEIAATVEGLERFLPKTAAAGKGTIYALFAGIDQYERLPGLKTCARDAGELAALLPSLVSDRRWEAKTLFDLAASGGAVKRQLESYCAKAREEDVVLFYFAGHGRNRLQGANQNQLLFYDFDQSEPAAGSLSEDDFRLLVRQHARQDPTVVLILDTHAGRNGWLQTDRDKHLIIAGCTNEQYAVEGETHGLFTGALLEVLQQLGGRVTYRRLLREVRTHLRGAEQLPLLWATENGAARPFLAAENESALYLLEQLQAAGYYGDIRGDEGIEAATAALDRFRREWGIEQEEDILEALEQKALADRREELQLLILTGYEPERVNAALAGLLDELTAPVRADRYRPGQRSERQAQSKMSTQVQLPGESDHELLDRIDRADLIVLLIDDYFLQAEESAALVQRILYRQQTDYLPVVPLLVQDGSWASHPVAQLPGMELYRMKGNFLDPAWIETTGMQLIREKVDSIGRFTRTPAQRALLEKARKYDPAMPLEAMETLVTDLREAAAKLEDLRFLTRNLSIETPHGRLLATAVVLQEHAPTPENLDALTGLLQVLVDQDRLTNYRRNLLFHLLLAFDGMIRRDNEQTPPAIDEERRRQLIELLLRFDQAQIKAFEKGDNDLSLLVFDLVPQVAASIQLSVANIWLTSGNATRAMHYQQLSPSDLALPEPVEAGLNYLETCERFDGEMPVGEMDTLGKKLAGQATSIAHFHFLVDRLRPGLFQGYIFGAAKGIEAQPEPRYFGPLLGYLDRISRLDDLNYDNLRLRVLYRLLMGMEAILKGDNAASAPAIDEAQREEAHEALQRIRATPRAAADAEKNKRGGLIRRIDRVLEQLNFQPMQSETTESRAITLRRALFQLGFTPQLAAARKIDISPDVLPILMPAPPPAGPSLLRDRLIEEFVLPPEGLVQLNINELAAYGFDERTFLKAVIDQLRLDSHPKLEEFAETLREGSSYSELVIYLEDHRSLPEEALRSFALAWLDFADRLARALREHLRAGGLRRLWLLLAVDALPAGVPPEVSYNWYAEPVLLPPVEQVNAEEVVTWAELLPEEERKLVLEKILPSYQPGYPLEVIRSLCHELEAEEVYDRYFREYERPDAPA